MKLTNIFETILKEENVSGKHLVVVDIQPEYKDGFNYFIRDFINFLNANAESFSDLTFLYNGESLGMISEGEYRDWWIDWGLDEELAYNTTMYDKSYAFFRYCMDSGLDEDSIVNLVKFMVQYNINDSRDMTEEFWNKFIDVYGNHDVRELMEFAGDCISIPDLMDFMRGFNNIILCGGGVNECLKEVEIALKAMNKPFTILDKFTY